MDALPVNVTDLAVIAVVVISGLLAFVRGFVHEVLAVGAWIGAAIATVFFLPAALPHARDLISIQIAADIAAGAAIFILVLIVLSIFTHWLARRVRESGLAAPCWSAWPGSPWWPSCRATSTRPGSGRPAFYP